MRPFEPVSVRKRALAAWEREGLTPIGLHEARHTCARALIASGVNPKAIRAIMGHANIRMTFDTYGHLMPDGLDEGAGNGSPRRVGRPGVRASCAPVSLRFGRIRPDSAGHLLVQFAC